MEQLSKTSTKVLTYGLTHVALKVTDIQRSIQFYQHIFNVRLMYHTPKFAQVTTPGSNDIIVFEKSKSNQIGTSGGIAHFGFRLMKPEDIEQIAQRVVEAGGVVKEQGEFLPGEPYLFFFDPDGYELEVWYESLNDQEQF